MEEVGTKSAVMTAKELWNTLRLKFLNEAREVRGIAVTGGSSRQSRWWNPNIQEQVMIEKQR